MTEYTTNYSDTSRSLWQFKRDESPITDAGNLDNVCANNSLSFKYKSSILGEPDPVDGNEISKSAKIVVSLKYLGNF